MELANKIDPSEVLSHLNQLGYQNITPSQLKEFIRDLRKLIVHDQLSSSSGSSSASLTSLSSSISSESEYFSTTDTSSNKTGALSKVCVQKKPTAARECNLFKGKKINQSSHAASNVSTNTACSVSTLRRSSTSSSSISEKFTQKENMPVRRGRTKSVSEENLQEAVRPKTSFIRPWQLQGAHSGPSRGGLSDPVSRYHYYQSLWAKHKCPGEDSHADLRWVIREKMLGQDPHLYSKNIAAKKTSRLRV